MSINTSSVSQTSSSNQVSYNSSADTSKKTDDFSFQKEMESVSSKEKCAEPQNNSTDVDNKKVYSEDRNSKNKLSADAQINNVGILIENNPLISQSTNNISLQDVNMVLATDIQEMININNGVKIPEINDSELGMNKNYVMFEKKSELGDFSNGFPINNSMVNLVQDNEPVQFENTISFKYENNINMDESDAAFFIELAQNKEISTANIVAQAQIMLDQGAEVNEIRQNVQISQTLLNAINTAKENNQPLRIDFDQNMSVILRISRDGTIAANFIPGDSAVEKYLRENIASLKNSFDKQELPYSDLSYSNRGSRRQKENRRSKE